MNTPPIELREQMAESGTFVIWKTDEGFRVCLLLNPGKQYLVSGLPAAPCCTCSDFTYHDRDPAWQCKHIVAVLKETGATPEVKVIGLPVPDGGCGSNEPPPPAEKKPSSGSNSNSALMVLKRSVCPGGRIDSLHVEFSTPTAKLTLGQLREKTERILVLQGEIAAGLLKVNGKAAQPGKTQGSNGVPDALPGQLLTAWRLFNVVTETIKGGLRRLTARTQALHDVLDEACSPQRQWFEETGVEA